MAAARFCMASAVLSAADAVLAFLEAGLDRRSLLHLAGNVFHSDQHARFQAGTRQFVGLRSRIEGVFDIVVLLGIGFATQSATVATVSQDQSVRRHQRACIRTDAQRGQPEIVQKLAGDVEAVALLHLLFGKLIEEPHAFVGRKRQSEDAEQEQAGNFHETPEYMVPQAGPNSSQTPFPGAACRHRPAAAGQRTSPRY